MNSKTKKIQPKLSNLSNVSLVLLLTFNLILTIVPPIVGLLWFNNMKKTKCNCSNIKWYIEAIGLDYKEVINKINRIPKIF